MSDLLDIYCVYPLPLTPTPCFSVSSTGSFTFSGNNATYGTQYQLTPSWIELLGGGGPDAYLEETSASLNPPTLPSTLQTFTTTFTVGHAVIPINWYVTACITYTGTITGTPGTVETQCENTLETKQNLTTGNAYIVLNVPVAPSFGSGFTSAGWNYYAVACMTPSGSGNCTGTLELQNSSAFTTFSSGTVNVNELAGAGTGTLNAYGVPPTLNKATYNWDGFWFIDPITGFPCFSSSAPTGVCAGTIMGGMPLMFATTWPTSAQIPVGNLSSGYAPQTVGGDCTISNLGSLTCTKANNGSYPTSAFFLGTNGSGQPVLDQPFANNPQIMAYLVSASDFTACKTISVASGTPFAIQLVASGGTQPVSGQCIWIINYSSGAVTITRNGQNINGGTGSLVLPAASATSPTAAFIVSDGMNYEASLFGNISGPAAAVTSGDLASWNGTTGNIIQDASIVASNVITASSTMNSNAIVTGSGTKTVGVVSNIQASAGKFTTYNGISLVNLGVPSILGTIDQIGVSTANSGSAQTIYMTAASGAGAAGHYRLFYYADQSGACSNLTGASIKFNVGWTDATHARTLGSAVSLPIATADTGTGLFLSEVYDLWSAASSAITITATYTVGSCTGTFTYDLHAYVEEIE